MPQHRPGEQCCFGPRTFAWIGLVLAVVLSSLCSVVWLAWLGRRVARGRGDGGKLGGLDCLRATARKRRPASMCWAGVQVFPCERTRRTQAVIIPIIISIACTSTIIITIFIRITLLSPDYVFARRWTLAWFLVHIGDASHTVPHSLDMVSLGHVLLSSI